MSISFTHAKTKKKEELLGLLDKLESTYERQEGKKKAIWFFFLLLNESCCCWRSFFFFFYVRERMETKREHSSPKRGSR